MVIVLILVIRFVVKIVDEAVITGTVAVTIFERDVSSLQQHDQL